jgi:predicted dehydrogenase
MMGTYLFPIESEDEAIVNIELASGALVSLCISGCPYGNKEHFDLIGERGAAGFPWHMRLRDASAQQRIEAELDKRFALPSPWKHKLDAFLSRQRWTRRLPPEVKYHEWFLGPFLDAIQGRGSNPVSALEARKAVELCTAIYTAALTGEPADLPLDSTTRFYRGVPKDDYVVAGRARSYGQS